MPSAKLPPAGTSTLMIRTEPETNIACEATPVPVTPAKRSGLSVAVQKQTFFRRCAGRRHPCSIHGWSRPTFGEVDEQRSIYESQILVANLRE